MSGKSTEHDASSDDVPEKEATKDWSVSSKAEEPVPEAKPEGKKEENEEQPKGLAFAMIIISVLSSLFLVALVIRSIILASVEPKTDWFFRIERLSPPPFPS